MTSFKQVFGQMFKEKWKWIRLVWVIQLAVLVIGTIILILQHPHGVNPDSSSFINMFFDDGKNLFAVPVNLTLWLIYLADLIFLGILVRIDAKLNLSQTWRLLPISESKFWQANIWSSFVSCVVIFIPQVIVAVILMAIEEFCSSASPLTNWFAGLYHNPAQNILGSISFVLILVSLVLLVLIFADFAVFASNTITDFVPAKNIKVLRIIILLVLVVAVVYFGSQLTDVVTNLADKQTDAIILANEHYGQTAVNNSVYWAYNLTQWAIALEFLVGALVFGVLDNWLMKRFVESRATTI